MPIASNDGNNEWGVFVNFPLCCHLWEMVMVIYEFVVVEVDVGNGLVGEGIMGLEAFVEKNV